MPRLESIAFSVGKGGRAAEMVARRVVAATLGADEWRVQAIAPGKGEFEAVPRRRRRAASRARAGHGWDRVYRLRQDPRVEWAEPLFEVATDGQHPPAARAASDDPRTDQDYEWSLTSMRAQKAWELFELSPPGAGIVVGHPDTGYTEHPEIVSTRLLVDAGFDFEGDDSNPIDDLVDGPLRNPSHGTGTSSVIMSGRGKPEQLKGPARVSGVAPGASLVPIRTTKSVVLWSMRKLTRAIRYAIDQHHHVVSISLGGPFPSRALHSAVQDAAADGIVVLCAAGNQVEFVVFPAAFDEVIAVAASTIDDEPWSGSCRGPAVDVTAPGASIWRAVTTKDGAARRYDVARSDGTSYAVAGVAGLAALWLSFHGRSALIAKYGRGGVAPAFRDLLQRSCRRPQDWDAANFGAGLVDARRLLEAKLPAGGAFGVRRSGRKLAALHDNALEKLVHVLSPAPRSGVAIVLARVLGVPETLLLPALARVGDEIVFLAAADAGLRRTFQALADAAGPQAAGRAKTRPRVAAGMRALRARLTGPSASRQLKRALAGR